MRSRPTFWISLCLLLAAGALLLWRHDSGRVAKENSASKQTVAPQKKNIIPNFVTTKSASTAPMVFAPKIVSTNSTQAAAAKKTNPFAYRLSNTTKAIGELAKDPHAVLLANAFIDSDAKLNFSIPKNLQSQGDPGAYIVQAGGPIDQPFRAMLAAAGAQIVSYIPNNAYLVRASAGIANGLAGQPNVQAVYPYEPYYKLSSQLLGAAVEQNSLPNDAILNLGLFADNAQQTVAQIEKLGGKVVATDSSPFGPIVRVQPPSDWTALATLPGVQIVEMSHTRAVANDLARVALGISTNTVTATNYLGLTGKKVVVEMNDTGVDANHPDFLTPPRVFGDSALSLVDTNGHGTHVAGIIAGSGLESTTVSNAQGSINPGVLGQYRGKAPLADLYSVAFLDANGNSLDVPDSYLQSAPATNNALISNNSWVYVGDSEYDLAAASYDAAVRDALPQVTGSQPVLFVFAAGNNGDGDNDGGIGTPDSIESPATAKNVITVGALEQLRQITNIVTDINSNSSPVWQPQTDSGVQVAFYSSRGNVGIGTEGTFGRFKPDVVAPGSFVISTRSGQWDEAAYYNPTNYYFDEFSDVVTSNSFNNYLLSLSFFPPNTTFNSNIVSVSIEVFPNISSPIPFPNLQIYGSQTEPPDPADNTTYDFGPINNHVSIPPDGGPGYLTGLQDGNLFYAIVNTNNETVDYDVVTELVATNENGNYFQVFSNLNDSIGGGTSPYTGGYYRYESGTSMAAPAVSGVLALMQDYFTNQLAMTPSPALLKAMVINGSRSQGSYDLAVAGSINFQGWGLANLTNSLPLGDTNQINVGCSSFFLDQSPTNALATGDSQTFTVTATGNAQSLPLRVTLAWTDPPGNPAAAIKLVNNLDLVVSNKDNGAIYFGNDIGVGARFNSAWNTNNAPNLDSINNVENVFLPSTAGTNFSVTVIGRSVNVNAVTAQTNTYAVNGPPGTYAPNVVQDFALVISCGEGEVSNAITVVPGIVNSNPGGDQDVTVVTVTNTPLLNQTVGANTPLLGTNTVGFSASTNLPYASNAVVTVGMTNQWHFYVLTNNGVDSSGSSSDVTNAAFVTFVPDTLSIPRMGVFGGSDANSTRPEADIDVYVSTDSSLTNLNPVVISNCVNGTQVGMSIAGVFNGASLGRGGTEFVVDTNSTHGQVYYVGVKSEDQNASEYGFLPVFTATPFSELGPNGEEIINGVPLPVNIPGGSPAHPGTGYVLGLALYPMVVQDVIVTNQIIHQNFGDLIGALGHNGISDVLNNHVSLGNPPGPYGFIYDDGPAPVAGSQRSYGPGSLQNFTGTQAIGPWMLTEVNDTLVQTGEVSVLQLTIQPHLDLKQPGIDVSIAPNSWFYGYVDVPVGYTNLTVSATNLPPTVNPPLQLFVEQGAFPTLADTNAIGVSLTNGSPPGNSISIGPPLQPGRYFVGIYNPSGSTANVFVIATLAFSASAIEKLNFDSSGSEPILDDAVTYSSINVTNTDIVQDFSVGLRVDHPRISDLVFHLISPDGTRYLLMENRGGTTTNGCGLTLYTTNNIANVMNTGANNTVTNPVPVSTSSGTLPITWDFFNIPDEMTVYDNTNGNYGPANLLFDTHLTNGTGQINLSFTTTDGALAIIMNQFATPTTGDAWTFTAGGVASNFLYLAFTEDTNLTTTPIKFAPPPFVPSGSSNLYYLPEQDISAINGQSAAGTWQLEIQDDRAGAGLTNTLVSWQLQFTFANTSPSPVIVTPGNEICNTNPANSILWYQVNVPLNAVSATNILFSADAPVNLLFNQNSPSTSGDITLLSSATTGSTNLSATSLPPLVPGSTYYLGVQNLNNFPVDACIEVDFDLVATAFAFTEPAQLVTGTNAQLNGMATPNGYPSIAWFQWGTNTLYGSNTPPVSVSNSFNVVYVTNQIGGLVKNVEYHFRLVVSNAVGTIYGFDQILDEAYVVAWGANFAGQKIVPAGLSNVVAIAGAYDHSLALKNNGKAVAWGDNAFNQTNVPAALNTNLVAVAGGQSYNIALKNSGTVVAWGANIFPGETNVPSGLTNAVLIASGQYSSLALKNDGTVTGWGANISGLTNVPAALSNAVSIAGGSFHNLGIRNDGIVIAWGDDSIGQTDVPAGLANVVAVSGGSFHSLALKSDGTVVAWGDDTAGQTDVPVGLSNVVAVAAGGFHSLALKSDGTIVAWGDDSAGQTSVPLGLSNVVAIAGGSLHSLALTPLSSFNSTPIVLPASPGEPQTNSILPGGVVYYEIDVPVNADFATNLLLFADAPLNILFTTNTPPTTNGATVLIASSTNGVSVLGTNSAPAYIIPGGIYYLGVQNTNSFAVTYGIEVDFHLVTSLPPVISSITQTNIGGTNGFLLTWFAPTGDVFQVRWTPSLAPLDWQFFTNFITYTSLTPTNGIGFFEFFDDGSQFPFSPPPSARFYQLILVGMIPSTHTNAVLISIIISTNMGVTNGLLLSWSAPTNDLFEVQWATNLTPIITWSTFPEIISYSTLIDPTNGLFDFFDDGSQGGLGPMKFYRLILLP